MWLPSCSVKLRMQPTWSDGSPPSIADSATIGCQAVWLLKSRSTAQTRSIGASMTAERVTLINGRNCFQRIERRLEHALPDLLRKLALALGRTVELGRPFGEGAIAVGDRRELESGDVVLHSHGALEDRVGALEVVVRQREQLLADHAAVLQAEVADAADLVRGKVALDPRLGDERRPLREAVEVADLRPDGIGRRFDDARGVDLDHWFPARRPGGRRGLLRLCPWSRRSPGRRYSRPPEPLPGTSASAGGTPPPCRSRSPRASLPTSPPSIPISRSSWSTSGAWAR